MTPEEQHSGLSSNLRVHIRTHIHTYIKIEDSLYVYFSLAVTNTSEKKLKGKSYCGLWFQTFPTQGLLTWCLKPDEVEMAEALVEENLIPHGS